MTRTALSMSACAALAFMTMSMAGKRERLLSGTKALRSTLTRKPFPRGIDVGRRQFMAGRLQPEGDIGAGAFKQLRQALRNRHPCDRIKLSGRDQHAQISQGWDIDFRQRDHRSK